MRRSTRGIALTCFTTLAILLGSIPSAEAGNGWGWKKPINQKLGAFYTSNKAFKRSKSSSSSYRHSTSYPRHAVTPTYSQPPSRTVIVQPAPTQQAQVQSQAAVKHIQSTPVQAPLSPAPVAVTSALSPDVPAAPAAPAAPDATAVQKDTRSAEERALELLGSSFGR